MSAIYMISDSIFFRELQLNDCEFLNEVRNECCSDFLHNSEQYSVEQTKDWYSTLTTPYYVVCDINHNKIGYFRTSQFSSKNRNIYIGMDIHKDFRGKGLAYLSYTKFIPFIFEKYLLNKVSLEVLSTNQIAINLYKKLGFFVEGIKREDVLKNGRYVDSIIMSILHSELKSLNYIYENC